MSPGQTSDPGTGIISETLPMTWTMRLSRWLGIRAPRSLRGRAGPSPTRVEGTVLGGITIRAPFSDRTGLACLAQLGVVERVRTGRDGTGDARERLGVLDTALVFEKLRVQLADGVLEVRGPIELSTPGAESPGEPIDERASIEVARRWLTERAATRNVSDLASLLEAGELRYRELLVGPGDPVEIVGVFSPAEHGVSSYRHGSEVPDQADWRARPDLGTVEVIDLTLARTTLPMGVPGES